MKVRPGDLIVLGRGVAWPSQTASKLRGSLWPGSTFFVIASLPQNGEDPSVFGLTRLKDEEAVSLVWIYKSALFDHYQEKRREQDSTR